MLEVAACVDISYVVAVKCMQLSTLNSSENGFSLKKIHGYLYKVIPVIFQLPHASENTIQLFIAYQADQSCSWSRLSCLLFVRQC